MQRVLSILLLVCCTWLAIIVIATKTQHHALPIEYFAPLCVSAGILVCLKIIWQSY